MAEDSLVGQTLGPCRLDALIGRGGMGKVYRGHHLALDRPVAVKIVEAGAGLAAILDEARSAAKLEDPRIVAIYEVGEARGIPYIVMQLVDGESLEARVKRLGRLQAADAFEIIRETALALAAAHKAGVVHRDIKPGNILVDARGAVKLTDFGIARPAGVAAAEGELVAGSFHFMAPEQAFGAAPDPRSDLYALGTTWYYALTAEPPYPGSAMDALLRHRDEAPAEIRRLRPEITERAASLLRRLMAKELADRPADANELLREMLSVGMLLDTDTSGSPFKILPAAMRVDTRPVPAFVPPPNRPPPRPAGAPPPAPPAPAPAAALGSKRSFIALLAAFGAIAFGWQWRRAGPEDWAAGAALLSLLPGAMAYGDRRSLSRRFLSAAACAGALACCARHIQGGGAYAPALEAAILAGLGVCALFGSALLGQWGHDRSEAVWSRVLGPAAGGCLLLAALTWTAPEAQSWPSAAAERAAAWWSAFTASGGGWRWLGTAGVGLALGAAVHLKVQEPDAPKDRKLNWNK